MLTLEQKRDNFGKLLNEAAAAQELMFFVDSGEGHEMETDTALYEHVSGWLVTPEEQDEFAKVKGRPARKWDEYYVFAEWRLDGDDVKIDFNRYPIWYDTSS